MDRGRQERRHGSKDGQRLVYKVRKLSLLKEKRKKVSKVI